MGHHLVERHVVERGHELSLGRRSVGVGYAEPPLFLLAGGQAVAERCPCHAEPAVGHRPGYGGTVFVALPVFHPGVCQQQAVAILFLINKLAVYQPVGHVCRPALDDAVARRQAVDYMHSAV